MWNVKGCFAFHYNVEVDIQVGIGSPIQQKKFSLLLKTDLISYIIINDFIHKKQITIKNKYLLLKIN